MQPADEGHPRALPAAARTRRRPADVRRCVCRRPVLSLARPRSHKHDRESQARPVRSSLRLFPLSPLSLPCPGRRGNFSLSLLRLRGQHWSLATSSQDRAARPSLSLLLPERRRQVEQLAALADAVLRPHGVPVASRTFVFGCQLCARCWAGLEERRRRRRRREGERDAHVVLRGLVALEEVAQRKEGVLAHGCGGARDQPASLPSDERA